MISEELRKRLSEIAKQSGRRPPSRKGEKHSLETRRRMSESRTKFGNTTLRQRIRNSLEMKAWRKAIFERDNYSCVICKARSQAGHHVFIEADHYPIAFSTLMSLHRIRLLEDATKCKAMWDTDNGRTLCKQCHLIETRKWRAIIKQSEFTTSLKNGTKSGRLGSP